MTTIIVNEDPDAACMFPVEIHVADPPLDMEVHRCGEPATRIIVQGDYRFAACDRHAAVSARKIKKEH